MQPMRADFVATLERDVRVVATIDHPHTTPPVRLYDGHLRLLRGFGDSALLLSWDVGLPFERTYRYDLQTDTGLIAKERSLYHYTVDQPLFEQSLDPLPWAILPTIIDVAAAEITRRTGAPQNIADQLRDRANIFAKMAESSFAPGRAPWAYTSLLLQRIYNTLEQPLVAQMLAMQCIGYFASAIRRRWIPHCIRQVDGPLSLARLLKEQGVILRAPFRNLRSIASEVPTDMLEIAAAIEKDLLVPSLDVCLWSLAVAGVGHYGNDFGFFARLAAATGEPEIQNLQLTQPKEDCARFIEIDQDYAILVDCADGSPRPSRRPSQPSKASRTASFGAAFVLGGDRLSHLLHQYTAGKIGGSVLSIL